MKKSSCLTIALKCMLKNNKPNRLLLVCVCILFSVPTLVYSSTQSINRQVYEQKKSVYGTFTDIYYQNSLDNPSKVTNSDLEALLPRFHYERFGVIYTFYSEPLTENRKLYVGYADQEAIELSGLNMSEGNIPLNNNEIAVSKGVAAFLKKSLGDTVTVGEHDYTMVGIFSDYGHLWPKGKEELEQNISPVNAMLTEEQAIKTYTASQNICRIILIERTPGIANGTEETPNFYQNVNGDRNGSFFDVPQAFKIVLYIISMLIIFSLLHLNKDRLSSRLKIYYSLGMDRRSTLLSAKIELYMVILVALFMGIVIGILLTYGILLLLSGYLGFVPVIVFDISNNVLLYVAMTIVSCILVHLNVNSLNKKIVDNETIEKNNFYPVKESQISLLKLDIFIGRRYLIITTLVIMCSTAVLAYGILYGFYYQGDALSLGAGFIPRDCDFQLEAIKENAAPLSSIADGKEHDAVFFTDTYEKNGASQEFLNQLNAEKEIDHVTSYRENTKMKVLLKKNRLDAYVQGYNEIFNLEELAGFGEQDKIYEYFHYDVDDVLANSLVVGYPPEFLQSLEQFVTEGQIDLEKIAKGEEVILRVPAYHMIERKMGDMMVRGVEPVDPQSEGAINATLFQVGDEITLSGILTDERINGGVEEYKIDSFYRKDVKVKIGAIMRTNDAELTTMGSSDVSIYSILTTNDAFDQLKIQGNYSFIQVYTKTNTDYDVTRELLYTYAQKVPHMSMEDWQAEVSTYKVYNTLVTLFASVLVWILSVVSFLLISNQLIVKTRMSLPAYALFRINGLPYKALVRNWMLQAGGCFVLGCVLSIPLVVGIVFILVGEDSLYYLPYYLHPWHFAMPYLAVCFVAGIATFLCLRILARTKDDFLIHIQ